MVSFALRGKRWWFRLLVICASAMLSAPAGQAAEDFNTSGGRLEIEVETLPETPYEQEMVLLTIRGSYPYRIALNELKQPALRNFGWMQLGRDRWFEVPGAQMRGFERIMAVFPQRGGNLKIDPFVHHMTLLAPDGRRIKHDVISDPVVIKVRAKPSSAEWWLPARGMRVTDSWDQPPDQLGPGESAVRTVTLEADGIGPELFPPIPRMRAPNLITFADPGERTTILTPQGPVSRVVWRWTVKPATSAPIDLEAAIIPWFNTSTRQHREIILAPQRVALADSVIDRRQPNQTVQTLITYILPICLLIGFLAGLALLMPGLRLKSREESVGILYRFMPDPNVWALRCAAWKDDPVKVRIAVNRLIFRDKEAGRHYTLPPDTQAHMNRIDANLYGHTDQIGPSLKLRIFVREFLAARRSAMSATMHNFDNPLLSSIRHIILTDKNHSQQAKRQRSC